MTFIKRLLNKLLIPGASSGVNFGSNQLKQVTFNDDKTNTDIDVNYKIILVTNKKIVMYFHVNGGFDYTQIKTFIDMRYNVIAFEFLSYGANQTKLDVDLDLLVKQSKKILQTLTTKDKMILYSRVFRWGILLQQNLHQVLRLITKKLPS